MAARRRVLVVENDPTVSAILCLALAEHGDEATAAAADVAITVARDQQPDLILCDVQVPERLGYQLVCELRADPSTARIPVVALSTDKYFPLVWERLLFNDRLDKPFDLDTLYAKVERWTRSKA